MNGQNVAYPYNSLKRNELLIHHTMWMNLQNNMLSKSNQAQNATYYMIPFT